MARRKFQVFDQYRYGPRSVLVPGDRFRVAGGLIYVTENGEKIPMAERGIFVFRRYCVRGASKWIEAFRSDGGGVAILWMGKAGRSRTVPNLRRRAYRITSKVHNRPLEPCKQRRKQEATLFL